MNCLFNRWGVYQTSFISLRQRKKLLLTILLFIAVKCFVFSDPGNYQNIFMETEDEDLIVETGLDYFAFSEHENEYVVSPSINIGYVFNQNNKINLGLPYFLSSTHENSFDYSSELDLSYKNTKRLNAFNLFAGSSLGVPISKSNDFSVRDAINAQGEGIFDIGGFMGITTVTSSETLPIFFNLTIKYDTGLQIEGSQIWWPGIIHLRPGFLLGGSKVKLVAAVSWKFLFPEADANGGFTLKVISHTTFIFLPNRDNYFLFTFDQFENKKRMSASMGFIYGHKINWN
jgi:hypothetical protein